MQKYHKILVRLYTLNLAILITHEIDSAFWKEWQLFGLPGGIQLFLVLNFLLIFLFLFGLERVIGRTKSARLYSYGLSLAGIFTFVIHIMFLMLGHEEFKMPVSLMILTAALLVSLSQIFYTVRINFITDAT